MKVAIFDTNAGLLQCIADTDGHHEAIRAFHKDVGLYEVTMGLDEILQNSDQDSLRLMDVTDAQAKQLEAWADHGCGGDQYPDGLPCGMIYTQHEIAAIAQELGLK